MPIRASATIIGHLGRDPEFRMTQNGKKVMNVSMAVNTGFNDNKRTTWWSVVAFSNTAESLEKFNLRKGNLIGFVGEPSLQEYQKKDGGTGYRVELMVREFIPLEGKPAGDTAEQKPHAVAAAPVQPKRVTAEAPFDDEIPF